jgi:hypothetical protein
VDLLTIDYILIHLLNKNWQPRLQFLRGRSVNILRVD